MNLVSIEGDPVQEPDDTFQSRLPVCYEILLYLSSRMNKLAAGSVLEFITSDPNAQNEIPPWCELRGFGLLSIQEVQEDSRWKFLIQKP